MKLLSLLVLSSSLAGAVGIRKIPAASLTTHETIANTNGSVLDIPRGGASIGPLEPETLLKAFCGLALAQGLVMETGPKLSNEMYGLKGKDNDAMAQFQAGSFGTGVISIGVMIYLLLTGKSLARANQVVYAIFGYHALRMLRSGEAAAIGLESGVKYSFAICAGAFWAMTQDFSETAIKVLAVFWTLCGVQMMFDPEGALKSWKSEGAKLNPTSEFLMDQNGWYLIAASVINLSILLKGASPVQAAGYNNLVWALNHAYHLVNGKYKALSVPENSQLFWMLVNCVMAYVALA